MDDRIFKSRGDHPYADMFKQLYDLLPTQAGIQPAKRGAVLKSAVGCWLMASMNAMRMSRGRMQPASLNDLEGSSVFSELTTLLEEAMRVDRPGKELICELHVAALEQGVTLLE